MPIGPYSEFSAKQKQDRVQAVLRRRRKVKAMAVALLGGACQKYGYNKTLWALDFHHRDPTKKSFGLSVRGLCVSWARVKAEVAKCDLLCHNCHAEVHAELAA
jgi:hypothetical protein